MANVDPEYDELLEELTKNRKELDGMLETATEFRKKVDTIIPDNTDFRKRYLVEEKMKLITSIFSTELDLRKQKENSIKNEIELRRKLTGAEIDDEQKYNDAVKLAKALEQLEGKKVPKFEGKVEGDTEKNIISINDKK